MYVCVCVHVSVCVCVCVCGIIDTVRRHALDMTFKPVSKKITKALLGLTMESEFLKKGKSS